MENTTTFRFKATKAEGEGGNQHYAVDLGTDILQGKDADAITKLATKQAVVEIQNRKGSLLRASSSVEEAQAVLDDFGYGAAIVKPYSPAVSKVLSDDEMLAKILKTKTPEQIREMLNKQ